MKCAVLCNGPSRTLFNTPDGYNYIIGCNIPWTKVDTTVVIDFEVFDKWDNPTKFFSTVDAWRDCRNKKKFSDYFLGFADKLKDYDSAGHVACRKLIKMNPSQIDIYGCDSWWENNTESFTHKYVDTRTINMDRHVIVWRERWKGLIESNPNIIFNFIGEPK